MNFVILSEVEGSKKHSLFYEILRQRILYILAQNDKYKLVCVILSEVEGSKRVRFDL